MEIISCCRRKGEFPPEVLATDEKIVEKRVPKPMTEGVEKAVEVEQVVHEEQLSCLTRSCAILLIPPSPLAPCTYINIIYIYRERERERENIGKI